jgi:hypothetical protein
MRSEKLEPVLRGLWGAAAFMGVDSASAANLESVS